MSFIRATVRLKHRGHLVERKMDRIRDKWLSEVSAMTITIARRSMRGSPKRANAPKYDTPVVSTFKSGKKKGQERRYVRRGVHSAPGSPPKYHAGDKNRSLKNMGTDRRGPNTWIAGPLRFNSYSNRTTSDTVPQVHEFGGTFIRRKKIKARRRKASEENNLPLAASKEDWKRIMRSKKKSSSMIPGKTVSESVRYPKRPFMKPAHIKALMWLRRNGSRLANKA